MTALAEFRTEVDDGVPVVRCAGEIDLANVGAFRQALAAAAVRDVGAVIVCLRDVTYIDSQGLHALLDVAQKMSLARQRLAVVATEGTTPRRVLDLAGAASACSVHESIESAIRYLADSSPTA